MTTAPPSNDDNRLQTLRRYGLLDKPSALVGRWVALKIALAYALVGVIWILVSDHLLVTSDGLPAAIKWYHTCKGCFFVLVTAVILAWGLERYLRQIRRAEAELRESEERFRLLVSGVRDYAIFLLDPQGRVTSWNSGAQHIQGYGELEILGQHFSCFYTPEEVARGRPAQALQVAATRGRFEDEGWRVRKNKKPFWASVIISALRDASGQLRGFAEVTRDITERKHAEMELRRANRALRAISACNQAVWRASSESELLHEICRVIVKECGYVLAWVGWAEPDQAKTVRPVAQAGYEAGYLETLRLTWADTERGRGPTGMAIRTGQHFVVQNLMTEPFYLPWREEATRRGYAASIALPLFAEGKPVGALSIYAAEPDAFDAPEVTLLNNLACDLSMGLTALRLRVDRSKPPA